MSEVLNLQKGGNVKLDIAKVNLSEIQVGLGWDIKADSTVASEFDLDVFGILVDTNDKGATGANTHFYNNIDGKGTSSNTAYAGLSSTEEINKKAKEILKTSVLVTTKDNLTGAGSGDDETLFVNSSLLPKDKKVLIAVNIYDAKDRKQVFGMVNGAYCRILNADGSEFCRYDLKEDFSIETGVIIGEIYWNGDDLKVRALGKGFTGTLTDLVNQHA